MFWSRMLKQNNAFNKRFDKPFGAQGSTKAFIAQHLAANFMPLGSRKRSPFSL